MADAIPEREPIGDLFTGAVIQVGEAQALTTVDALPNQVVQSGSFVIRYGIRFLGRLHISIVPGLLVLDYGEMMTGEAARPERTLRQAFPNRDQHLRRGWHDALLSLCSLW